MMFISFLFTIRLYKTIINRSTSFEMCPCSIYHITEMKGFEPLRRRTDLPDFESGPFSLLGTSPVCNSTDYILYYIFDFSKMLSKFFDKI